MRTLILDKEGNAIITTNDEYNSKGEKIDSLSLEHEALVKEFLKNKDEKTSKRLKEIKLEFIKLRGKTASNGRINI